MIEAKVPEFADSGYWYVVPVTTDPEVGGLIPDLPPGVAYAQWMNDGTRCLVRVLEPILGIENLGNPSDLLPINRKPKARLGGL